MRIKNLISCQIKGVWGDEPKNDGNDTSVIKTNNMSYEGDIDYSSIVLRSIPLAKAKDNYLKKGDLLIEKSGGTKTHSVGYVNYFDGKNDTYVCNNFILGIRPNNQIVNSKFLFWQLRYNYEKGYFKSCASKTTGIQNLKVNDYLNKEIKFIGSIANQSLIAKQLDSVNREINAKKEVINNLDSLVKSLFVEMFSKKDFEIKAIGELVDTKKITAKKRHNDAEEINYIDISSIDNTTNQITGFTKYIMNERPSRAQQALIKNDVLVSTVRPNLKNVALFNYEGTNFIGSTGFCVLRAKKCNPYFLLYSVLSDEFTNSMTKLTTGSNYPAIRDSDVLNYRIPVPPIDLQNKFASISSLIDKSRFVIFFSQLIRNRIINIDNPSQLQFINPFIFIFI